MALSSLDPKVQIPDFDTVFGNTIPNLENSIYLSASGKTPKEIIHVLEVAIEKMTKDPQFLEESKTKLAMVPQFVPSKIVMEEKIPKNMAIAKEVMKEIGTIK
jgi:tripartite-type tricarboxylate transporter receptor subunit TctC